MADKNQLKIADQVDLADDDPFAELTRIMGFDPRQPARQAAPVAAPEAPAPVEQAAEADDFSLDLEKELLGGFEFEDEQLSPESAAVEAQAATEMAETGEPEIPEVDFDFSSAFDEAMAEPDVPESADVVDEPASDTPAAASAPEPEAPEIDFASDFDAAMAAPEAFEARAVAGPDFDGDLDAAFAAAVEDETVGSGEEAVFDLDLTDEDFGAAGETTPPPLPVTPEAVTRDVEIEADLDAAMADFDFLADAPAPEPVVAAPTEDAPTAVDAAQGDIDLGLFDETDFRIEDGPAAVAGSQVHAEPEAQPEIDAVGFGEEELRLDDAAMAQDAQPPVDDFSFDDVDFAAELAVEPEQGTADLPAEEAPLEEPRIVAESNLTSGSDPISASTFEFSVPPYTPRKLPTSPMDVAAEEFRQREAASAPAGPEFNLEDELNALLGNLKSPPPPAEPATAVASTFGEEPLSYHAPADLRPAESPASEYPATSVLGSAEAAPHAQTGHGAFEPVGFEAPQRPADIDDNLNWELDEAFAEAEPEPAYEQPAYGEPAYDQPSQPYADDGQDVYAQGDRFEDYSGSEESDAAYAQSADAWEDPAPIDLDEVFDELADKSASPGPNPSYGDFLAGAAVGAAAGRFGSGFASRPFAADSAARAPELSSHRDPVVRGDPLKEDPLDIITQLAEKYSRKEPVTPYGRAMSIAAGASPDAYRQLPEDEVDGDIDISDAFEEQPEVETVEVDDQAIALADDLDIPELPEEDDLPPVSAYDDLDAEFSSLISDMNAEPQGGQPSHDYAEPLNGGFSRQPYENTVVAASYGARKTPAATYEDELEQESFAFDASELPGSRVPSGPEYGDDDYQFDHDIDQEIAPLHPAVEGRRQQPRSRGLLFAGVIGGVALVGAVGAFALYSGGGGEDTPVIVRADEAPVKVRPENPGGTTVPNQDNKVYETVAGEGTGDGPLQETLVTTIEEPMDVTPPVEDEDVAAVFGKSEDRIEQILEEAEGQTDAEIVAVAPRKVRTMVVRPDGTLMPREDEPGVAASSGEASDTVAAAPIITQATGALPAMVEDDPAAATATTPEEGLAAAAAQETLIVPETETDAAIAMPDTVPIAPLRPADQPVDVVGEVKPDQVAAATATAAAGGGWAMQIASQPSEAAAQASYQDLARRYGGVLQGRDVNIVRAEIPGKGTFWRVRVPAESRNEAISLCENYKAAGGNCFVSR